MEIKKKKGLNCGDFHSILRHISLFFLFIFCLLRQNTISERGGTDGPGAGVAGGGAAMVKMWTRNGE